MTIFPYGNPPEIEFKDIGEKYWQQQKEGPLKLEDLEIKHQSELNAFMDNMEWVNNPGPEKRDFREVQLDEIRKIRERAESRRKQREVPYMGINQLIESLIGGENKKPNDGNLKTS